MKKVTVDSIAPDGTVVSEVIRGPHITAQILKDRGRFKRCKITVYSGRKKKKRLRAVILVGVFRLDSR